MTAAMIFPRQPDPAPAGVIAPPESRRAAVWDRPVPGVGRAPLVWLLGVHGGAGASTLAHVLAPAADSGRRWPGVFDRESPFVVLVARETIAGLSRAHDLLRQHLSGFAGPCDVLGLITVAARPGRMAPEIRRYRDVVGSLAGQVWQVPWYEEWTLVEPEQLPVWSPGDPLPPKKRKLDLLEEVPLDVRELGADIVAAARTALEEASYDRRSPDLRKPSDE
ncbi:hypothetical protein IU486_33465 [Streptomyces gardneri]|uniref:DUF6668 family protein n=1 Tax=Nocardia TaxID=1817 RepID=UPI00135BC80F|nr:MULTISPECIES: DUF6668 family protein [Nocardia]MBF6169593.1 hypothetical protein [Streptomyces gardneri]MBF6209187.1 hypothetical protein [Streptomyces gardneri]UAK30154.1 hypothetical protein K8O92_19610 [Nocardia asteroides]